MAHAVKKTLRVKKKDSAFLYCLLESYEGMTSYSTLDSPPEALYRDIELLYSPDAEEELQRLLDSLEWITPIETSSS